MIDIEALKEVRHYLHRHPELSKYEFNTQKYLLGLLRSLSTDGIIEVAGTGILVTFKGQQEGVDILFRADIDALPIQELNSFEHRSTTDHVSHKCGHDGHATILYGLAKHYSESRPQAGNVYLIFQPAEEVGWGAQAIEDSGVLKDLPIDYVFALHNVPLYPLNEVVCRVGSFTPSVTTLVANFIGHTAHAAEPWNGLNPAKAMSEYMLAALQYNKEQKTTHEFVTITPVCTTMGDVNAYGTSSGEGSVHLTIRADSNEKLNDTLSAIKKDAEEIAESEELKVVFEQRETFESNQNDKRAVRLIKEAAVHHQLSYQDKPEPFRWGEDFGLYTNRIKGAMFGLGSGVECKPLHHPEYDFPDDIIEHAINLFATIQEKAQ